MSSGEYHMPTERVDDELLRRYLLGRLSDEEQVRVEDRAFADAGYVATLAAVEADLIDSYVRGELPQLDRRDFERRFLTSTSRRSKIEFARALARVAEESNAHRTLLAEHPSGWRALLGVLREWHPALQFAAGMAVLLCFAGATWLTVQNASIRSQVGALEAQRREGESRERSLRQQLDEERGRAGAIAAQVPNQAPPNEKTSPLVASLVLVPGLSRAESRVERLVLNSSAQIARIEIQLEARDEYPRYRAELSKRNGEEVLARSNLSRRRAAAGFVVAFDVPASALAIGDYELALKGGTGDESSDIGYFYFHVQKQ
jgi:hypothetical protein